MMPMHLFVASCALLVLSPVATAVDREDDSCLLQKTVALSQQSDAVIDVHEQLDGKFDDKERVPTMAEISGRSLKSFAGYNKTLGEEKSESTDEAALIQKEKEWPGGHEPTMDEVRDSVVEKTQTWANQIHAEAAYKQKMTKETMPATWDKDAVLKMLNDPVWIEEQVLAQKKQEKQTANLNNAVAAYKQKMTKETMPDTWDKEGVLEALNNEDFQKAMKKSDQDNVNLYNAVAAYKQKMTKETMPDTWDKEGVLEVLSKQDFLKAMKKSDQDLANLNNAQIAYDKKMTKETMPAAWDKDAILEMMKDHDFLEMMKQKAEKQQANVVAALMQLVGEEKQGPGGREPTLDEILAGGNAASLQKEKAVKQQATVVDAAKKAAQQQANIGNAVAAYAKGMTKETMPATWDKDAVLVVLKDPEFLKYMKKQGQELANLVNAQTAYEKELTKETMPDTWDKDAVLEMMKDKEFLEMEKKKTEDTKKAGKVMHDTLHDKLDADPTFHSNMEDFANFLHAQIAYDKKMTKETMPDAWHKDAVLEVMNKPDFMEKKKQHEKTFQSGSLFAKNKARDDGQWSAQAIPLLTSLGGK